jgi:ABC-type amino acid transport substrate-binding protein
VLKKIAFIFFYYSILILSAQDTLNVFYIAHPPFAEKDTASQLKGLEIDLINEYTLWLKTVKKMDINIAYKSANDEAELFDKIRKSSKNAIAIANLTIKSDQLKNVDYTVGYLKNTAFCITNGNAPDVKTKNQADVVKILSSMTALTILSSNLGRYTEELKKTTLKELKIVYKSKQSDILDEVSRNVLSFGFVDAVQFWIYLKNNPTKFLKIQKPLNQAKEEFCCAVPKGGVQKNLFNEFFTAFKATRNYRTVLEKYLGSYMTQNMAIN